MKQLPGNSRTARWLAGAGLMAAVAGLSLTYLTSAGAQTTAASTPRCHTRALALWLGIGNGGAQAGSTSYPVELTNVSGRRCQLFGYPGVSAQLNGQRVGSPARRNPAVAATTVTLAPGATAHAMVQFIDVAALPGCTPVTADSLRIYPPGAVSAALVPFRFRACSTAGPRFLSVQVVQPRVGVPGRP